AAMYSVKYRQENAHDESIWSVAWAKPDRTDFLVTGSLDDRVKVWRWSVDHCELLHTLEGHHLGVISVDTSRDGTLAASLDGRTDSNLGPTERKQARFIDAGSVDAWTVSFSPDGKLLATGSNVARVNLFEVSSGNKVTTLTQRASSA
ncbi:hypothetical protein BOX15_Mlig019646g1, partial [Macrostomum lignano]